MSFDAPEPQGPTPEELAAAERAKIANREATSENVALDSDRIFRLYMARGGPFGM